MRIIICDDDKFITSELCNYLHDFFGSVIQIIPDIVVDNSGDDFLKDTNIKDIVFLDIEMPGTSGLSIGNRLSDEHPDTLIFVITSYMEYLDDAMRFHVFRYLSKPIDKQRLFRNLNDAISELNRRNILANRHISVCSDRVSIEISLSDIAYIESLRHKTIIRTMHNEYSSSITLTHWLEILPKEYFIQIHRSYIVNMQYICDYDQTFVYMCGGKFKAFITSRKYSYFKKAYLGFIERSR